MVSYLNYEVMILVVSGAGKIVEAFWLLYYLMDDEHKLFLSMYVAIIKALCQSWRFVDAFSFFANVKLKGCLLNRPAHAMFVKMCARGCKFIEIASYYDGTRLVSRGQLFDMVVDGLNR